MDEIHNLKLSTRNGADVSDMLKYFSERIPSRSSAKALATRAYPSGHWPTGTMSTGGAATDRQQAIMTRRFRTGPALPHANGLPGQPAASFPRHRDVTGGPAMNRTIGQHPCGAGEPRGERDPRQPHRHPDSVMYTLSGFQRRLHGQAGSRDVVMEPGQVHWLPAQTHAGENTGTTGTHVLFVELKN